MAVIFVLTVLGGAGLLTLAVWPGMLEDTVFGLFVGCLSLFFLGCWFLLLVSLAARDLARRPESSARCRRWGLWSATVMFGTIGLLWFHVPQRIAFALCCSEFRGFVDAAPAEDFRIEAASPQFGLYRVDRIGRDRRGGVFFRTHTGPDGLGPDRMSYGFAFRPNGHGTPFGNAYYSHRHLFGDWYVFAASDDW